jgi:hypothetical protein
MSEEIPLDVSIEVNDTLTDAYKLTLALVEGKQDDVISIVRRCDDRSLADLMSAACGVIMGLFSKSSPVYRSQVGSSLRYAITGDPRFLESVKAAQQPTPGQYL